jgi:hypothetical protein
MKTLAASLIFLSTTCVAQVNEPRSLDEIKRGVAGAVERHAISYSCTDVKVGPQDVMALSPNESGEAGSKFVVVWTDTTGCSGRPGTHIAIATVDSGDYVIDERLSTLVEEFDDDVSYLQRVVNHSDTSLTLEGKTYGPYDSNKPSIPVRYTLRLDDNGHWKLADKIKLPFAL